VRAARLQVNLIETGISAPCRPGRLAQPRHRSTGPNELSGTQMSSHGGATRYGYLYRALPASSPCFLTVPDFCFAWPSHMCLLMSGTPVVLSLFRHVGWLCKANSKISTSAAFFQKCYEHPESLESTCALPISPIVVDAFSRWRALLTSLYCF
jgi:hypothetical protein